MMYSFLADVVVSVHFAFLMFTLVGQLVIFAGLACKWQWVRNPWFRCIHLAFIIFVAMEYVIDLPCPLTTWENNLHELAGDEKIERSFVGRCLDKIVFFEDLDPLDWKFMVAYISFAALVLITFIFAPPRFKRCGGKQPEGSPDLTDQPGVSTI